MIKCGVRTSAFPCQQDALFIPNESPSWLDVLEIGEIVVNLQKGTWSQVAIPVTNRTEKDIILSPRTFLGQVQWVKAIYPMQTKPVEKSNESRG